MPTTQSDVRSILRMRQEGLLFQSAVVVRLRPNVYTEKGTRANIARAMLSAMRFVTVV